MGGGMRVLVACEESGAVRDAFRALGHDAWSCDLQECSADPEYHIQGDVLSQLHKGWDLLIGHPTCTYLCNSGVKHLHTDAGRWPKLYDAADFFVALWNAPIRMIALENPIPHKYAVRLIGEQYTQLIQPYQYGHPESKATCLWLKGLPRLRPTDNVKAQYDALPKNEAQRMHYMRPGPERAKERSKTFPGIAQAMAEQWSEFNVDLFGRAL